MVIGGNLGGILLKGRDGCWAMTESASNSTEDSYFILRDVRAILEKRMVDVAQRAGMGSQSVVKAFAAAVGDTHDMLASDKHRDGFELADSLTSSKMTLMCDADLELDIRIGDVSRKLLDHSSNPLWRAHQRYITLLKRPAMKPDSNPVGLEAIAAGFRAVCETSSGDHARKMELLNRLEEILSTELPVIYEEINDALGNHGIEPAAAQITQLPSARRDGSIGGGGNGGGGNGSGMSGHTAVGGDSLGALQRALGAQFGGGNSSASDGGAGGGANAALSAATLVMLNQLSARLDQLQRTGMAGTEGGDMSESSLRAIKAADLDLPLGNPEGIALETLGHIFEAIFNIWDLPDTVKTALGRLQIPLLRLSVTDPTLFSDENHPARRLINAIGRAAVGLPRDVARSHPISSHVWQISSSVSENLHSDASVLATPLSELDALIVERDAAIKAAARPFIDHLVAKEAEARNADLARQWLQEIAKRPSAREIHDFLRQYWVQVMELAALVGGATGTLWVEAASTATDLMWSVQPKGDAEDRKKLANLVPGLIRRINAGLDQIGISQDGRKPFLDACFNLQTSSLRGMPAPTMVPTEEETASAVLASDHNAPPSFETVGTQSLHWLMLPGTADAASYRAGGAPVQLGQWIQLAHESGKLYTGLAVWSSAKLGITLLSNPDWGFALCATAAYLDGARRAGQLQIVSNRAIFDLAAQQALSQLTGGQDG